MRRTIALAVVATVLTGCPAHWKDLKKIESEQHFVLQKDYTRTQVRGIGVKWVEGLRAGVYSLAAEDDDGFYYRGDGQCVVKLPSDSADDYLKTGTSKLPFLHGGLWLPKQGIEKDPKLFYIQGEHLTDAQVGSQANAAAATAGTVQGPPTTVAGAAGGALGGALVGGIIAMGKGEVLFINYGSEKDFVAKLNIVGRERGGLGPHADRLDPSTVAPK